MLILLAFLVLTSCALAPRQRIRIRPSAEGAKCYRECLAIKNACSGFECEEQLQHCCTTCPGAYWQEY